MNKVSVKKKHVLSGHKDCLYTLTRLNEQELISAGGDGMIVKWGLSDADNGQVIAKVNGSVYAMALHQDHLLVMENNEGLHVINLQERKEAKSVKLGLSSYFDIQVVNGHYWIAAGNGEVIVVSPEMMVLHREQLSDKSARSLTFVEKRNEVAIGFSDHTIKVLDAHTFKQNWEIEAHEKSVFSVSTSPGDELLLSGSRDAHLKISNTDNYTLHESVVAHMYAINAIDYSPSGQYFVTCSMDKSVKVWDAQSFKLLKVIDKARHAGHATSVNKVKWLSDSLVASCSDDRTVSIWELGF